MFHQLLKTTAMQFISSETERDISETPYISLTLRQQLDGHGFCNAFTVSTQSLTYDIAHPSHDPRSNTLEIPTCSISFSFSLKGIYRPKNSNTEHQFQLHIQQGPISWTFQHAELVSFSLYECNTLEIPTCSISFNFSFSFNGI